MNENEFEHDGKVYVAADTAERNNRCHGCAFHVGLGKCSACCNVPQCNALDRADNRNVIFVEDLT